MILPGFLYFLIFKYIPMSGLIIAFQDYQAYLGVTGSPWVGLKHFERLFTEPMFFTILGNTAAAVFEPGILFSGADHSSLNAQRGPARSV